MALAASVVLLVTAVAYLPALDNGFTNWDDPWYVTNNATIRSLCPSAIGRIFTSNVLGLYTPLSVLSLAVDYRLFGLEPAGYHAVNLGHHLASTFFVLGVIRLLSGSLTAALAGSLLFGVHPFHVESVAWVSERKDVLSGLFFFAALGAWLRRPGGRRPRAWYLLALALLAFSLLAKPMGVSFPLVLYLCDYLAGRRIGRREHLEKIPFFAVALFSGLVTLSPPGFLPPVQADPLSPTALVAFFVAAYSLLFYLAKALFPFNLSTLYPYPNATVASLSWQILCAPLAVAAIAAAAWRAAKATRTVPFALLYFCVTLLPVIVVPIGWHFAADRYFYIPSLGLCYLAGIAARRLLDATGRRRGPAAAARAGLLLLVAGFALLTWRRTSVWRDGVALWENVIASYPASVLARKNLGLARLERGDSAGAVEDLTVVLSLTPQDPDLYCSRGSAYVDLGMLDRALADFNRAVGLRPDFAEALNNRGSLLAARGEQQRALGDFDRALTVDPRYRLALLNRARARESLGDPAGAEEDRARARSLER